MLRKLFLTVLLVTCLTGMVWSAPIYENACESLEGLRQYYLSGKLTLDANGRTGNCLKFEVLPDSKSHPGILFPSVILEPFAQYEVSVWTKGTATSFCTRWRQYDIYGKRHLPNVRIKSSSSWVNTKLKFRAVNKGGQYWPGLNYKETNSILIDDVSVTKIEEASVYLAKQDATTDAGKRILGQAQYLNSGKITILESIVKKNVVEYEWLGDRYRDQADEAQPAQMKALYFKAIRSYLKAKGMLGEDVEKNKGAIDRLNKKITDIGETMETLKRMGL